MAMVEYAFNVFPATHSSSAALQVAHILTLMALWITDVPKIRLFQQRRFIKEM